MNKMTDNMEKTNSDFSLEVWGEFACFTRPEFKVERLSYDVITPSAARAIFESIFWKPAIKWIITKIEVINPIKWTNIRRNEVGALAGKTPIYIEDKRQQKNSVILKDVRYRIHARMEYIPPKKRKGELLTIKEDENPGKYLAMFERRASKGQCFNQPYLGCREFSANFRLIRPDDILEPPINESKDLQYMLYDMDFANNPDAPLPMFYRAEMVNGVINVPSPDSNDVLK